MGSFISDAAEYITSIYPRLEPTKSQALLHREANVELQRVLQLQRRIRQAQLQASSEPGMRVIVKARDPNNLYKTVLMKTLNKYSF